MTIDKALSIISVSGWGYTEPEISEAVSKIKRELGFRKAKPPTRSGVGAGLFPEAACPACGSRVYQTEGACANCG